jgi:hypothetical protein
MEAISAALAILGDGTAMVLSFGDNYLSFGDNY